MISSEPVVHMLTVRPTLRSTAFKCNGCEQTKQVAVGQVYYVDPHGLAPANLYCEECVAGS